MARTTNNDIAEKLDALTDAITALIAVSAYNPAAVADTVKAHGELASIAGEKAADDATRFIIDDVQRKTENARVKPAKLHDAYRIALSPEKPLPSLKALYGSFPDATPVYGENGCLHLCYPSPNARKAYIENGDISGLIIRQCANHVADGSHECTAHRKGTGTFAERANGRHDHAERMYEKMIAERGNVTGESASQPASNAPAQVAISELLAGITGK